MKRMRDMRRYAIALAVVMCLLLSHVACSASDDEAERWVEQGNLLLAEGSHNAALRLYQDALRQFQASGNRISAGYVLIKIGAMQSDAQNALTALEEARRILREQRDALGEANALLKIGHLRRKQGEFLRALEEYLAAAALVDDPAKRGVCWGNIGAVYTEIGQYWDAFRYYQRALPFLQNEQDFSRERGTILLGMGINDARLERNREALRSMRAALALFEANDDQQNMALALTAIGGVCDAQSREACQYSLDSLINIFNSYRRAREIVQKNPESNAFADALNNIGLAYMHLAYCEPAPSLYRHAEYSYRQSLAIARQTGNHAMQARTLTHLAEMRLDLCRFEEKERHLQDAERLLEEALSLQRAMGEQGNAWLTLSLLGRMNELRGEERAALSYYSDAIDALELALAAAGNADFQANLSNQDAAARAYQRAMLLLMRQRQDVEAFEVSERARARAFLDKLGNLRPKKPRTLSPQLRKQETDLEREAAELSARIGKASAQEARTLRARLDENRRRALSLREQIDADDPEYGSLRHVIPPKLAEIQARLTPDTTLVSYMVTPDATVAFIIARDAFQAVELPIQESRLAALVRKSRQSYSTQARRELYRVLISPLEPHLRTSTIAMIPHGVLHYLSFAALHDGRKYLHDRYALLTLPSAAALKYLPVKPLPEHPSLLMLANAQPAESLPALRGAAEEVWNIGNLYGGEYQADMFVSAGDESNATESRVQQDAGKYHILHLAAHGALEPSNPMFSALLLSGDAKNDGRLNAHEVYDLDLRDTTLVVLSACDTSLGQRSRGDEMIGLSRAFMHAGTPSVLASLWKVDDRATLQFMRHFYFELAAGKDKARALRAAQRLTRIHYPNPRDWAGFVLIGRP